MTTFSEDLDIATGVYTDRDRREEAKARVLQKFEQLGARADAALAGWADRAATAERERDAARAEVTRLTDAAKLASEAHMRTVKERDELRAELTDHDVAGCASLLSQAGAAVEMLAARVKELETALIGRREALALERNALRKRVKDLEALVPSAALAALAKKESTP